MHAERCCIVQSQRPQSHSQIGLSAAAAAAVVLSAVSLLPAPDEFAWCRFTSPSLAHQIRSAAKGRRQTLLRASAKIRDSMYPDLSVREVAVLAMGSSWAAVYNPAGVIAHPKGRHNSFAQKRKDQLDPSMVDRISYTFGRKVHLIHRLDCQVSGLSLVAFDPETCAAMQRALQSPEATKVYYALCRGDGSDLLNRGSFELDRPLRDKLHRNEALRHVMRESRTEIEVLWGGRRPSCCFVRALPRTGRWHQIRRHLQNISLPIVGDHAFKKQTKLDFEACGFQVPKRVMLHLHSVSLPATSRTSRIEVSCPLPPEFSSLIREACSDWAADAEKKLPQLFASALPNLYRRGDGHCAVPERDTQPQTGTRTLHVVPSAEAARSEVACIQAVPTAGKGPLSWMQRVNGRLKAWAGSLLR
eukprot:TRINITY_DN27069_c0_g1_i1.p1 TRINITY_DN27069_c0_g1~~TRINITY_DN27069_c0_g1_i1.p1  ORF type:complete len:416 (+),score=64.08 TRINITY_DN27069_c0_g1_i1:20-1267(+)